MEELGFVGFSIGFYEECSQVVGTSATLKCFTPELVEYLHAVVIAGELVCNKYELELHGTLEMEGNFPEVPKLAK